MHHSNSLAHIMLNRLGTLGAIAALTLLPLGCRHATAVPELSPAAVLFAREFIRVLEDSGSVAILPLATPQTRSLKNFAQNMDVLRGILAESHATLTLARWNYLPQKDGGPRVVHVVYTVTGVGAPSDIAFWIEEESGRYLLNTIAIGSPNSAGAR